jgi:glutaredoxin
VVALLLALAAAATNELASRAYDPRRTNPAGRVVVYATAWCPVCARLRTCLASSGVPFDERDVERSPEADAQHRELGGGGVPVTLVGPRAVHGLDVPALGAALAEAGHRFDCRAR